MSTLRITSLLAVSVFIGLPWAAMAEAPKDTAAEITACLGAAQLSYNEAVSQCLIEASAILNRVSTSSLADYQTSEEAAQRAGEFQKEYQSLVVETQKRQAACYGQELVKKYNKEAAECYARGSFGQLWDKLPVLHERFIGIFSDYKNLSPEVGQELSACVESWSKRFDINLVTAEAERGLSQCFTAAGLQGLSGVYEATSVVIDCAQDELAIETATDAARLAYSATPKETAYIEQCVIKRLAPAVTGLAVLNIPLAAGWHNVFLFGQLVLTQPLLLLRRRKFKTRGRVFDSVTDGPVDLGSVRLLNYETDKVIATAVTDRSGGYFFLPVPGAYRLEVDKPDYLFPSALRVAEAKDEEYYFGEIIDIQRQEEVIDRHIPVDPHAGEISVARFYLRQWRYRLALAVGLISPGLSLVVLFFSRAWWVVALAFANWLLLALFLRLGWRRRPRQFGVVTGSPKGNLSGVVVSLFRKGDNKLLHYYVTDLFGRYFFPPVAGEFSLTFVKKGYAKVERAVAIKVSDRSRGRLNLSVQMEKS